LREKVDALQARPDEGSAADRRLCRRALSRADPSIVAFGDTFSRKGRRRVATFVLAAFCALAGGAAAAGPAGDANRGEQLYEACTDCHSLDKNDVGPRHRGVFGRKAASLPDYDYSDALKSANIVWNEETLDKWLTDPQAFVPGVKMFFHLDNPQDRADVIAFLKERAK
jgi:cytochrome c